MLSRPLALHNPNCRGLCAPADCIQDVEKLAQSVLSAHERAGVKRNGCLDRPGMTLTESDREDLLAYLIAEAWKASQRFDSRDDGRGSNRLAGFVVWTLHKRLIDWVRVRFGSTRYPGSRLVATLVPLTPSIEKRIPAWLDPEPDVDGDYGLGPMPDETRAAFTLIEPLIADASLSQAQLAVRGGVSTGRVGKALRLVREEATRQGLAPAADAARVHP